jgi:hypothetical protein
MRKIISITDLPPKTKEDCEGYLIALDEMSYSDWRTKLRRAKKQLDAGEGIELEALLKEGKKRKRRLPQPNNPRLK